jgi:signal transduction histidine kinase
MIHQNTEILTDLTALLAQQIAEQTSIKSAIGHMGHEWRTPVSVIRGYTDLLLLGSYGPLMSGAQTEVLKQIKADAAALADWLNQAQPVLFS